MSACLLLVLTWIFQGGAAAAATSNREGGGEGDAGGAGGTEDAAAVAAAEAALAQLEDAGLDARILSANPAPGGASRDRSLWADPQGGPADGGRWFRFDDDSADEVPVESLEPSIVTGEGRFCFLCFNAVY